MPQLGEEPWVFLHPPNPSRLLSLGAVGAAVPRCLTGAGRQGRAGVPAAAGGTPGLQPQGCFPCPRADCHTHALRKAFCSEFRKTLLFIEMPVFVHTQAHSRVRKCCV